MDNKCYSNFSEKIHKCINGVLINTTNVKNTLYIKKISLCSDKVDDILSYDRMYNTYSEYDKCKKNDLFIPEK